MIPFRLPLSWQAALFTVAAVIMLGAATLFAVGWYYSETLRDDALGPDFSSDRPDLTALSVSADSVTLGATSDTDRNGDWQRPGVFGLEWQGGYGQVGAIIEPGEDMVTREFTPMLGDLAPGEEVRLDSFAFPGDPLQARGIDFRQAAYESPLGTMPAWIAGANGDTWAIFVHGKDASRRESLRILPTLLDTGLRTLVITYRNDPEAPPDPSGLHRYGETEWRDLEAAAQYALGMGAQRLVLVGYSMGGAIAVRFLLESPLADRVAGVILDSPVLDFGAAVDYGASDRGIPGFITWTGKTIAGRRFDIDWDGLDYLSRSGELRTPILLFHGDDDDKAPVSTSDALAAARPDLVTYVRTPGAGHVRSWNADPEAYESAVRGFLRGVAPVIPTEAEG